MSARRSSVVLVATAVALVAPAAVARFVLGPNTTKLPGDTDRTAHCTRSLVPVRYWDGAGTGVVGRRRGRGGWGG
ncbi:hypothetical protein HO151_01350 [Streptomyces sp. 8P21H-1]|nr:hypothetical protein [Streptomyces sp. 8P21H-1]